MIGDSPAALQLRYLQVCVYRFIFYFYSRVLLLLTVVYPFFNHFQTLNTISAEKNSTIVFPLPIDMLTYFLKAGSAKDS